MPSSDEGLQADVFALHDALDREKRRDQGIIALGDGKANVVGSLLATITMAALGLAAVTVTHGMHATPWALLAGTAALICFVSTLLHAVAVMLPRTQGLLVDESPQAYMARILHKASVGVPIQDEYDEGFRLQCIARKKVRHIRWALLSLVGLAVFLIATFLLML